MLRRLSFRYASWVRTVLCLAVCMLGLGASSNAQNGRIITFDAPGASIGTEAMGINAAFAIVGNYTDANYMHHGFVRDPDGTFTTFDVPNSVDTGIFVADVNSARTVAGLYLDTNNAYHGFLRTRRGVYTSFDVLAADDPNYNPQGLNMPFFSGLTPGGVLIGSYYDANWVSHGWWRTPQGHITMFDCPFAGTGPGQGTVPVSINPEGAITGSYTDSSGIRHGFIRAPGGAFTSFDVPGALGIDPQTNNAAGQVTGYFWDANYMNHGFLRDRNGTITVIDVPSAGNGAGQGTQAGGINAEGAITGTYADPNYGGHSFLWLPECDRRDPLDKH